MVQIWVLIQDKNILLDFGEEKSVELAHELERIYFSNANITYELEFGWVYAKDFNIEDIAATREKTTIMKHSYTSDRNRSGELITQ